MPKTKILVIDDQRVVHDVCAAVLQKHGFDPIVAVNGVEGLDVYEKFQQEICLTLLDVSMPVMDGIEVARCLFAQYAHPNVILMTGYSVAQIVPDDLMRLCSVLQKPFTSQILLTAVRKCLAYEDERSSASND